MNFHSIDGSKGLKLALVLLVVGCRGEPAQSSSLSSYLERVAALDPDARAIETAGWRLDRATWNRIVVPPFDALYDDYAQSFQPPGWVGSISTRPHYAGDPELTDNQARARWLLPTLFPAQVATADRRPIDAVFVRDREHWYALVGIDRAIRKRIDRRDPSCGAAIDTGTSKTCRDAAWAVAEATLRTDDLRFVHACAIATTACAKPSR